MADETKQNETVIEIAKGGRFDQDVPIQVNGKLVRIKVGVKTPVGDHILEALNASDVDYTVVSRNGETGAAIEGVSGAAPSEDLTGTAIRAIVDDAADASAQPSPVEGKPNAQPTDKPAIIGEGDGGNGDGSDADSLPGGDASDETKPKSLIDGTIAQIKAGVGDIATTDEIDALIAEENARGPDKARAGALAALEARKAELEKPAEEPASE